MTKFTSKVKMPEPAHRGPSGTGTYFDSYSKQQMEDYANERVKEALEDAAQEANDWSMQYVEVDTAPRRVGDYIRALINDDTE